MNNYIDINNKIWGFDENQESLIPVGAILIPSIYTPDQYPFLTLVNGVIKFDSDGYNSLVNAQKIEFCKAQAKLFLQNTDWSEIPSVTNTENTPHLINSSDFVSYRNSIRALAINPVINPVWPVLPKEQWS